MNDMMNNWNGWYSLRHIQDLKTLKEIYYDFLKVNIKAHCDVKDDHYCRVYDPSITPEEYIEKYLSVTTHNVCCNRYVYNGYAKWAEREGEISSCTVHLPFDKFLFIHVSIEDLEILVEKYNLPKML